MSLVSQAEGEWASSPPVVLPLPTEASIAVGYFPQRGVSRPSRSPSWAPARPVSPSGGGLPLQPCRFDERSGGTLLLCRAPVLLSLAPPSCIHPPWTALFSHLWLIDCSAHHAISVRARALVAAWVLPRQHLTSNAPPPTPTTPHPTPLTCCPQRPGTGSSAGWLGRSASEYGYPYGCEPRRGQ